MEIKIAVEKMNKKIFGLLIFSILFVNACTDTDTVQEEKLIPVKIYKVQPAKISSYINLTGSVTGENDADVYSKISDKLETIFVKPGQKVNSGQILAVQHNVTLKQSVDLAKTAVKTAQAQYDLVNNDFERMNELFKQRAVSQQQFDQIKTQKKTAETSLDLAKLQLEQADENYQNSFIKAPFGGIVGAIFFEQGQMVPAGQPVIQVVSASSMKAKLKVPSKEISSLSVGQSVDIKFPSINGKEYKGKVVKINHAIDQVSNLLEIEVQLLNPDKEVKSGIFGEFFIEISNKDGIIAVPENSLMQRTEIIVNKQTGVQQSEKKYFLFAVEKGFAKLKEVKTGINSDGRIEIVNGLSNVDTVIVVGQNIVRDGQKVKVVE